MRKAAPLLFPALLALSLALHFWAMRHSLPQLSIVAPPSSEPETTEILMVEELPEPEPTPEATPEPIPEPTPEPTPAPTPEEKILAAPQSEEPPVPEPTPQPTPQATPPPKKPMPRPTTPPSGPRDTRAATAKNTATPVVIKNTPPSYPEIARQKGWEGRAIVRVEVSAEGRATKVTIAKSSGYGVLDQSALRAVKQWRFQPRTIAGIPAPGVVDVPVNFGLNR